MAYFVSSDCRESIVMDGPESFDLFRSKGNSQLLFLHVPQC